MTNLLAFLFAASLSVTGGSVSTLTTDPGPLVFTGIVDGCPVWEGSVHVSANLPWRLSISIEEPCGPSVPETDGANVQDMTISYRIGTTLTEPLTVVSIVPIP